MHTPQDPIRTTLAAAGANRTELERALKDVPGSQRRWMEFLVAHMPARDAASMDADLLLETCAYAARVRGETPCGMAVPEAVFLEHVLPYAHLDERRDRWRPVFYDAFAETARRSASIADAVSMLNRLVFEHFGVTYHATRRPHDAMGPLESIEWGFASCTGLSVVLACACRSVGIPARLVGTPLWADGAGNHTWVEIWDHGEWHFLGASEPGPFDSTWFNDRARVTGCVHAARFSPSATHFPLAWAPDDHSVPSDDVTARYRDVAPNPTHPTDIITEPRHYLCHRVPGPIAVTGRMDDSAWARVPWTDLFVDIEGHRKPTPRFATRARLCWDDRFLYVGAQLDDPHVWATLTEHNAIIFNDPDFEVFIDPDGDHHGYYELEVNALGTTWELTLGRPYRDGGPVHRGDDLPGLVVRTHVDGTLNDPSDVDRGWSVEIAIPWTGLACYAAGRPSPPHSGDVWRMNFSRVHWLADILGDTYRKVPREAHPEDNWVWTPQDAIDMHRPERWGRVEFTDAPPDGTRRDPPRDPTWPVRERLMDLYYQQRARAVPSAEAADFVFRGVPDPSLTELRITADGATWDATLGVRTGGSEARFGIDHTGRFTRR